MKVLILKPSSLGDIVQAMPVLRLIKRCRPEVQAFWWVDSRFVSLLTGDPDLTGVIRFERQRWGRLRHWPEMLASIRSLRAQRFDWVVDLQGLARSGVFAWLANGRFLIGLDERREGAHGLYDVAVARASWRTHAVDWYLSVLPWLGVPASSEFEWLPVRRDVAAAVREKRNPTQSPFVALLPGARWENKRWPAEYFAELPRQVLQDRPDVRFVVFGGKEDVVAGASIAAAAPSHVLDMTGKTTLPELVEWLRGCQAVVTNDTGPMHIAAALGKPVVAILGPTEPSRTGPYGQSGQVLQHRTLPCVPCMKPVCHFEHPIECLRSVSPKDAASLLLTCLRRATGSALDGG